MITKFVGVWSGEFSAGNYTYNVYIVGVRSEFLYCYCRLEFQINVNVMTSNVNVIRYKY